VEERGHEASAARFVSRAGPQQDFDGQRVRLPMLRVYARLGER